MPDERPVQLLTFLGTGVYGAVPYRLGAAVTEPEPFVQVALVKLLRQQGVALERVSVCLTAQAAAANWETAQQRDSQAAARDGLRPSLEATGLRFKEIAGFPEGKTADELWLMLQRITAAIDPACDLIVDVTHGFRCFPIVLCIALAFLKQVRGLRLRAVYYGAFDARDAAGVAPIFDLSPLLELLDWSTAVSQLLDTGNATRLAEQIQRITADGQQPAIQAYGAAVGQVAEALSAAAADATARRASALADLWPAVEQLDLPPHLAPVKEVLQPIQERYAKLVPSTDDFASGLLAQLAAAELLFDHQQWQPAYTLLEEVQLILAQRLLPETPRQQVGSRIDQLPSRHGQPGEALAASYHTVGRHRNALNHAWHGANHDLETHQGLRTDGPAEVALIRQLVAPLLALAGRRMLVVLNHRLTPEQESEARRELGVTAIEYPEDAQQQAFASVDPAEPLTSRGGNTAPWLGNLRNRLLAGLQAGDCALIQGEPGVTCYLVRQFEAAGIACYHATTRRESEDVVQCDGSVVKRSTFRHVMFRRYRL